MGKVAIFLDGGYVEKVFKYGFGSPKIDFKKLAEEMSKPDELLRTYYYNCLPYKSDPPTAAENDWYAKAHRFITALSYLPRYQTRLGKLVYRGNNTDGEPIFIQKRIDCMVGVDMALLAGKGRITNVALFTGDSDFIPAIEAVKQEGVLVTLWHGAFSHNINPSREVYEVCDERVEITQEIIDRMLRI